MLKCKKNEQCVETIFYITGYFEIAMFEIPKVDCGFLCFR